MHGLDPSLTADCPRTPGTIEPEDPSRQGGYTKSSAFSTEPILAGLFVCRRVVDGANDLSLPHAADDVTTRPCGIVIKPRNHDWRQLRTAQYAPQDVVTYMRSGRIWIQIEAPVTQDGAVFARFAAGPGGTQLGAIRGDSDSGTCTPIRRTSFRTSSSRYALVEINLP